MSYSSASAVGRAPAHAAGRAACSSRLRYHPLHNHMDDFAVERPELTGALISMEFGAGGRIQQLWASDPNLPEEGEEFQFILPPIQFGEEFAEDYFPGTVLIGARTQPDDPWILSRNTDARPDGEQDDVSTVGFEYEFPLLPEIQASGRFYELAGAVPQVVWDVKIANAASVSIEIGELGFPFAFNNFYEGFSRTDKGLKSLWADRVYIHKYIGGAAAYVFAQRMNAEPPGLLVFPGADTSWEFYSSVRASLNTPYRWEGIPIVYALSRAAMEREGWNGWFNDQNSLILEPGDSRTFQTRFVPAQRDRFDGVAQVLAACGRPNVKLLPSAVAPAEVGIALEVTGATPTRFFVNREASMETDSDEEGGFCFVKPREPGPLRVSFEDTQSRFSHAHLYLTEPIDKLIQARAKWIVENQVHQEPDSSFHCAILPTDFGSSDKLIEPDEFSGSFAVEAGLADTLFLAEKNTIFPVKSEIETLDACVAEFVRHDLQNPSDDSVGSAFADARSVAYDYGRPQVYALVFNLYVSMYRVASGYGETRQSAATYLQWAFRTAAAMYRNSLSRTSRDFGVPLYAGIWDLIVALRSENLEDQADLLQTAAVRRASDLLQKEYPFAGESVWDTVGFAEVFASARALRSEEHVERTLRCAYAARSLSPSWWWYGTDKRQWDDLEGAPRPATADMGELCAGYTTPSNSRMYFDLLDKDYGNLSEAHLRQAFGGALSSWALVRSDGCASMGFCPDRASKLFGSGATSGDIGIALYDYLRLAGAYVLPSRSYGVFTFGCHFESEDGGYRVRPWDGVGRKVILRQIGAEFHTSFGRIRELQMDARKRRLQVELHNPAAKDMKAEFRAKGLWGTAFESNGRRLEAVDGEVAATVVLPKRGTLTIELKVIE